MNNDDDGNDDENDDDDDDDSPKWRKEIHGKRNRSITENGIINIWALWQSTIVLLSYDWKWCEMGTSI